MCYPSYIFPLRKQLSSASQWIMNLRFVRDNTIMWYFKKLRALKSVFYLLKCISWNISHVCVCVYMCVCVCITHRNTETHWSLWENSKGAVSYYRKIESETSFIQYGQIKMPGDITGNSWSWSIMRWARIAYTWVILSNSKGEPAEVCTRPFLRCG